MNRERAFLFGAAAFFAGAGAVMLYGVMPTLSASPGWVGWVAAAGELAVGGVAVAAGVLFAALGIWGPAEGWPR